DIETECKRTFRHATEDFLGIALPITAMNENEERRSTLPATKEVYSVTLARAIAKVEQFSHLGAQVRAASRPLGEFFGAVPDCRAVVIRRIQLRTRHAAPYDFFVHLRGDLAVRGHAVYAALRP